MPAGTLALGPDADGPDDDRRGSAEQDRVQDEVRATGRRPRARVPERDGAQQQSAERGQGHGAERLVGVAVDLVRGQGDAERDSGEGGGSRV